MVKITNLRNAILFSLLLTISIYLATFIPMVSLFFLLRFSKVNPDNNYLVSKSLNAKNDFAIPFFELQ